MAFVLLSAGPTVLACGSQTPHQVTGNVWGEGSCGLSEIDPPQKHPIGACLVGLAWGLC